MSQQEFVPRQQQSENEDEIYAPHYPYSWSGNLNAEPVPRDEPPSNYEYDAAAMQQGYQAQDGQTRAASEYVQPVPQQQQQQQVPPPQYQYNPYTNDGDAYEQGYNPNNNARQNGVQGVPPWARPQEHRRAPFRFGGILFVLIMISLLQGVFTHGMGFADHGDFGFIIGAFFLPVFILLLIASSISRRAMWGGRRGQGGRGGWRRRGPWGW